MECAPDAMLLIDADGKLVTMNPHAEKMFGAPRHALRGVPAVTLIVSEQPLASMNAGQSSVAAVCRRVTGQTFPAEIGLGKMAEEQGELTIAIVRDITERQRIAEENGRLVDNGDHFHPSEMDQKARERLELESDLRHAVDNNELLLHYQPRVDFATGSTVGVEALVRWRHPVRGIIPPTKFIPIAEENGLIEQIGLWVLENACAQAQAWRLAGLPRLCLSVNLSARQFQQPGLDRRVQEILEETGLDPACLELEITESTVMRNTDEAITTLRRLKRLGVALSIDDFGTGYSSLSCLKLFPIDILKIDRSFVQDVIVDVNDAAIIRAIIALAYSLDLEVVAEGVETIEQAMFLQACGCHEMQGYYFSRPVPPEELEVMLHDRGNFPMPDAPRPAALAKPAEPRKVPGIAATFDEQFRLVFEHAPLGMLVRDRTRRALRANRALREMLGYADEELARIDPAELVHPEDRAFGNALEAELFAGKRDFYQVEQRYLQKNHHEMWCKVDVSLVRDTHGAPRLAVSTLEDITDRKHVEASANRRLNRYRQVLNATGLGICGLNRHGVITSMNPAGARLLGWHADDLIGRPARMIPRHGCNGMTCGTRACPISGALRDGLSRHCDSDVFLRKDGVSLPVEYTVTPIMEQGTVTSAIIIFIDKARRLEENRGMPTMDGLTHLNEILE